MLRRPRNADSAQLHEQLEEPLTEVDTGAVVAAVLEHHRLITSDLRIETKELQDAIETALAMLAAWQRRAYTGIDASQAAVIAAVLAWWAEVPLADEFTARLADVQTRIGIALDIASGLPLSGILVRVLEITDTDPEELTEAEFDTLRVEALMQLFADRLADFRKTRGAFSTSD